MGSWNRTSEVDPMLPLTLGKILDEERQRQIESTLQRRRWLAPSEPEAAPPGSSDNAVVGRHSHGARSMTRAQAQDPGTGSVCSTP